jgi:predicted phage terminase large subunit-like protein
VVRFAHLQLERDKLAWQGTQLVRLAHDELNQFSESSVHYLRSRLRSVSGIRPYTRSTTNADADSWVANFLQWWWDPETGFPIPNRAGVVRWFVREEASGIMKWSSSPHDLKWAKAGGVAIPPTSVTFIPARLEDNQILLAKNPEYRTTLMSLPPVELAQLYYGNWKIKPAAGSYFKRHWFQFVDAAPLDAERVRWWDWASTKVSAKNKDPDWTAGVRVAVDRQNRIYIEHVARIRDTPAEVEKLLLYTAERDGPTVTQHLEQEPGASGVYAVETLQTKVLFGFSSQAHRSTGDKLSAIKPLSSQTQANNVYIVRGEWNEEFIAEAEQVGGPDGTYHDDQIESAAKGFSVLANSGPPMAFMHAEIEQDAARALTVPESNWERIVVDESRLMGAFPAQLLSLQGEELGHAFDDLMNLRIGRG